MLMERVLNFMCNPKLAHILVLNKIPLHIQSSLNTQTVSFYSKMYFFVKNDDFCPKSIHHVRSLSYYHYITTTCCCSCCVSVRF